MKEAGTHKHFYYGVLIGLCITLSLGAINLVGTQATADASSILNAKSWELYGVNVNRFVDVEANKICYIIYPDETRPHLTSLSISCSTIGK